MLAHAVAEPGDHPRLVLRDPVADTIAQRVGHDLDVLGEGVHGLAHRPAPAVLERLRQIPVIERDERLDPVGEQLVHEPVVEVEAGRGSPPAPAGRMRGQAIENR